jgi:trimethylamine--corrinoid protein Co-methyltransferase
VWGRDGEHRLQVVPDRVYFGPGPTSTYFIDPQTGERRRTQRGDPGMAAQVCDALAHIDYVMGLGMIDDVPPTLAPVYEFAEMMAHTTKPILPWALTVENASDIYQIALAVAGSEAEFRARPNFALFASSQPPLIHPDEELAAVFWAAERGVPVVYLGSGIPGTASPVTSAGALVISTAATLSGLTMIQLKQRGAPVCIGSVPQPTDLRTARPAYGGPELSLNSAAMVDITRHLGLPFMGTAGASEAKTVDVQAAIESTFQVLLSGLSGATLVHDVGFLDCGDIGSLEMLILNDEIIAMTRRVMRGIEVTDETMMLDLIDRVGPAGEFLSAKETAKRCRQEIWMPTLLDRTPWESWEAAGAPTVAERLHERLQDILENHQAPPLPEDTAERIQKILQAAEARLA